MAVWIASSQKLLAMTKAGEPAQPPAGSIPVASAICRDSKRGKETCMQWSLLRPVGLVPAALVLTTIAASAEGGKSAGPSEFLLVAQIVLLIAVGRGLGEIMQRIGQPSVIGELLAGILLGPSLFGWIWPEAQHAIFPKTPEQKAMIDGIAQFGILLLLLLTGMETDLKLVRKVGKAAIAISIAGIARAVCLRLCARRVPARCAAAEAGAAAGRVAVHGHGAVDLFREDRRRGRARDEFHAPQCRPDHRRDRRSSTTPSAGSSSPSSSAWPRRARWTSASVAKAVLGTLAFLVRQLHHRPPAGVLS